MHGKYIIPLEMWSKRFKSYWDQNRSTYESQPLVLISQLLQVLESNILQQVRSLQDLVRQSAPDINLMNKFNNVIKWNDTDARECLRVFSYNPDKKLIKVMRELELRPQDPTTFAR